MEAMVWLIAVTCVAVAGLVFLIAPTGTQLVYLLAVTVSVTAGAVVALGYHAISLVVVCILLASATIVGSYAAGVVRRHRNRLF